MEKNLVGKLATIKEELSKAQLKKTGRNKFSGFDYYELADILPAIISLCKKYGVYTCTTYDNDLAKLVAINTDNTEDKIEISSPMVKLELKGCNAIQAIGGVETYSRRYLYMALFDIVEADSFDATAGSDKNVEINYGKVKEMPKERENKALVEENKEYKIKKVSVKTGTGKTGKSYKLSTLELESGETIKTFEDKDFKEGQYIEIVKFNKLANMATEIKIKEDEEIPF